MQVIRRRTGHNQDHSNKTEDSGSDQVTNLTKFVTKLYDKEQIIVDGPTKVVFLGTNTKNQCELLFISPKTTKIEKVRGTIQYDHIGPKPINKRTD